MHSDVMPINSQVVALMPPSRVDPASLLLHFWRPRTGLPWKAAHSSSLRKHKAPFLTFLFCLGMVTVIPWVLGR